MSDVRHVAYRGLGIPAYKVEKFISDNPNDAAYNVLRDWLPSQPNGVEARAKLKEVLKKTGRTMFIDEVFHNI